MTSSLQAWQCSLNPPLYPVPPCHHTLPFRSGAPPGTPRLAKWPPNKLCPQAQGWTILEHKDAALMGLTASLNIWASQMPPMEATYQLLKNLFS